jgi:hypothetical protein
MGGWARDRAGTTVWPSIHTDARRTAGAGGEEVRMKGRVVLGVAVVIAALGAPALSVADAAAPAPGVVLAGFSSQQYPAFFKLSPDGRTLNMAAIALDMNCTSGAEFVLHDAFASVRIRPNGRVHAAVFVPPTAESNGVTLSGTDLLTGRLGTRHTELSGIWRLQLSYSFTNGMSDRCDSGPVRFAATA